MILYRSPCPIIIIGSDNNSICTGDTVTIFSTVYYPGIHPTIYQWFKGTTVIQPTQWVLQTSSAVTYSNFANDDIIYCRITGSTCGSIKSNEITFSVNQKRTPTVSINWKNLYDTITSPYICSGETILFYITGITYGGVNPRFQWKKGNIFIPTWTNIIGKTGQTMLYIPDTGDKIKCTMDSTDICIISVSNDSNTLTLNVNPIPSVDVYITPTGSTCSGTTITYTANPINGGSSPSYIWFVYRNGIGIPAGTSSTLVWTPENEDIINVSMISNAQCASHTPVLDAYRQIVNDTKQLSVVIDTSPFTPYWYNDFYGTGGTVSTSGGYKYHKYTSSGVFSCISGYTYAEVFVVAGGGGGGVGYSVDNYGNASAGGGGAGEIRYVNSYLLSGSTPTITVTIGPGGNGANSYILPGDNGSNSIFGTITSLGGGGGGSTDGNDLINGQDGGSGGGGCSANYIGTTDGGLGIGSGYVHNGGAGATGGGTTGGGGGGGAGSIGGSGISNEINRKRPPSLGGLGISFTWDSITYNIGGGGCGNSASHIGSYGGGSGGDWESDGSNATPNTGGGGGGTTDNLNGVVGGNGGSGFVIIRYMI